MIIIDQKKTELANQIKRVVEENYLDPSFTLEKLSEAVFVSRFHLSSSYKNLFGIGFKNHLMALRIQKAKELLKQGKSVNYTSNAIGYIDVQHFIRIFKREVGVTPKQYKASGGGENNGSQNS